MNQPLKGYVATRLGQIHYRAMGDGPALVLLPHSGRSSRMFAALASELASRYRVFAFDLPGSGESPPLVPGVSFEAIADSLNEAVATLGLREFLLYGIHTGNKIGANMAANPTASVRKFVFAGQTHSLVADQKSRNAGIGAIVKDVVRAKETGGAASVIDWVQRVGELHGHCLSRSVLEDVAAKADFRAQLEWLIDEAQGTIARPLLYEANFKYDLERDLRRIAVPTLILEVATAAEDRRFGRQGTSLQQIIRGSRLATLEEPDGVGFTMEHRAREVAGILHEFFDAESGGDRK